jgi:hypothetical protein
MDDWLIKTTAALEAGLGDDAEDYKELLNRKSSAWMTFGTICRAACGFNSSVGMHAA